MERALNVHWQWQLHDSLTGDATYSGHDDSAFADLLSLVLCCCRYNKGIRPEIKTCYPATLLFLNDFFQQIWSNLQQVRPNKANKDSSLFPKHMQINRDGIFKSTTVGSRNLTVASQKLWLLCTFCMHSQVELVTSYLHHTHHQQPTTDAQTIPRRFDMWTETDRHDDARYSARHLK